MQILCTHAWEGTTACRSNPIGYHSSEEWQLQQKWQWLEAWGKERWGKGGGRDSLIKRMATNGCYLIISWRITKHNSQQNKQKDRLLTENHFDSAKHRPNGPYGRLQLRWAVWVHTWFVDFCRAYILIDEELPLPLCLLPWKPAIVDEDWNNDLPLTGKPARFTFSVGMTRAQLGSNYPGTRVTHFDLSGLIFWVRYCLLMT